MTIMLLLVKMVKSKRSCFDAALSILAYRARSEFEMRKKLKDREYDEGEIESVIGKLYHYNYLDDDALANDIFNKYVREGTYGDLYIHQKLRTRGLSIERHLSSDDEKEIAVSFLRKKTQLSSSLRSNPRKAAAMLSRRGFASQAVIYALRVIFDM